MAVVVLTVQPLGPPTLGLWCGRCLLPSVVEVEFVISTERATVGRKKVRWCEECGA